MSGGDEGHKDPAAVASPPRTLKRDEVLAGRYRIEEQLGGPTGVVYRARDLQLEELVAIKLLPELARDPELSERVREELRHTRRIAHPTVARLHDLVEDGELRFLTMEYVEGETLAKRIQRGWLVGAELARLALELAHSLEAAHEVGVLHRDLRPANVMLRPDGRAVVVDFGVTRLLAALGAPRPGDAAALAKGTYLAPEQLRGESIDARADVYAWGLLVYEAATGKVPLCGANEAATQALRVGAPPPDLGGRSPGISTRLARTVMRALAAVAKDRPASGRALVARLEPRAPASVSLHLPGQVGSSGSSGRPIVLIIGAALLLVGGVVALSQWGGRLLPAGSLPPGPRRVLVLPPSGDGEETWARRGQWRLLVERLGRDTRFATVAAGDVERAVKSGGGAEVALADEFDANVVVAARLALPDAETAAVDIEVGRPGGARLSLGRVSARSLEALAVEAAQKISDHVGAGRYDPPPTAEERAAMAKVGTSSLRAFHHRRRALAISFASNDADMTGCEKEAAAALEADPHFARAHLTLGECQGAFSVSHLVAVEKAVTLAADLPAEHPARLFLGAARRLYAKGDLGGAERELRAQSLDADKGADVEVSFLLVRVLFRQGRTDEMLALEKRLAELYPELQFGADWIGDLRAAGRDAEVGPAVAGWLERAPENRAAWRIDADLRLGRGDVEGADQALARALRLGGERPQLLIDRAITLGAAGRFAEARASAERVLLSGKARERSQAKRALGMLAVLQGRLALAEDALKEAAASGTELGVEGRPLDSLDQLVDLAWAAGNFQGAQTYAERGAREAEKLQRLSERASFRLRAALAQARAGTKAERARAAAKPWPLQITDEVVRLPEALRERTRLHLGWLVTLYAGPTDTTAPTVCAENLAATAKLPPSDSALDAFAEGECARRANDLARAAAAYRRATSDPRLDSESGAHPYYGVLARWRLAQVLAAAGDRDTARRFQTSFLTAWGSADRALPEVAEAKRTLAVK